MKKLFPLLLCACLLAGGCSSGPSGLEHQTPESVSGDGQTLHILTTTYPVYLLTTAVTEGAEGVEVSQLITETVSCLHDYTLTVTDMKAIEQADVIILNGAGLEDFLSDALAKSNVRQVVDCSQGLELLPAQGHEGHDHDTEYDPHIWMDPENASCMLGNIAYALRDLTGDDGYEERCQAVREQLTALDREKRGLSGLPLITFHDGFRYFAEYWGLNLLKAIEEEEGAETSAAEIKEIVALIEEYDIPAIFTEKNGSDATAQAIARETGVAVYQLDMIMSGEGQGIESYMTAMTENLDTILEAFG